MQCFLTAHVRDNSADSPYTRERVGLSRRLVHGNHPRSVDLHCPRVEAATAGRTGRQPRSRIATVSTVSDVTKALAASRNTTASGRSATFSNTDNNFWMIFIVRRRTDSAGPVGQRLPLHRKTPRPNLRPRCSPGWRARFRGKSLPINSGVYYGLCSVPACRSSNPNCSRVTGGATDIHARSIPGLRLRHGMARTRCPLDERFPAALELLLDI